jgi:hypothetical protein
MMGEWSGESEWTQETVSVTQGEHTFMWAYEKDQAVANGDDCAWIDQITFPPVDLSTGISQSTANTAIQIYPNPARDWVSISGLNNQPTNVELINLKGQVVISHKAFAGHKISLAGMPEGVYFVRLQNQNYNVVRKLVIR